MEADCGVIFLILSDSASNGFLSTEQFPLYSGTVTTHDGSTVMDMEYVNHTGRLPKLGSHAVSVPSAHTSLPSSHISTDALSDSSITASVLACMHSFSSLSEVFDSRSEAHVPAFLSDERIEGRLQQRFEHLCQLRKEAITLCVAHGHPNNRRFLLNLEARGIPHEHLKRYILALSCDACRAALGKCDNKTSAVTVTKRQNVAEQKKIAKAHCKLSTQHKSDLISVRLTPSPTWVKKVLATSPVIMRPILSASSRNKLVFLSRSLLTITRTLSILLPKLIFAS